MNRTRIKMCGTTVVEDARIAVHYGVDALGFIFAEKSPRRISRDHAWQIIATLPSFVTTVGVFVDSTIEQVRDTVDMCGLTQVQLHGSETPEFCHALKKVNRSLSVCKAFRVGTGGPEVDIKKYAGVIDSVLLDTYIKDASGGTGQSFDWGIIESLQLCSPLILAGGLGPDNIREAVKTVRPFCVDINSGIEYAPGKKDHDKLRTVVEIIQRLTGSVN